MQSYAVRLIKNIYETQRKKWKKGTSSRDRNAWQLMDKKKKAENK